MESERLEGSVDPFMGEVIGFHLSSVTLGLQATEPPIQKVLGGKGP